uniref:CHAT domain-containing protein n=1 Tax=Marinobacterium profundum TaxID=1714300 RepID=UPI000831AA78|nr:CHAT domain-containing protein [Marinobacterium profundum]
MPTLDPLSYLRTAAMEMRITLARRDYEAAVAKSDAAVAALQDLITRGHSHPSVWQSMLFEWSRLDYLQLEAYVKAKCPAEHCLAIAEAAKGRLFRLYRMIGELGPNELSNQEMTKNLISSAAQRQPIEKARKWLESGREKHLVSLFCSSSGIAVISLSEKGANCHWIDGPIYDRFRAGVYNHWEQLSDWALDSRLQSAALQVGAPPELVLNSAQAVSELMLDWLGNMLAQAVPDIAAGGDELVLIPHRCFRSLPLAHARLSNGKYLSELFERVTIAHTLTAFTRPMATVTRTVSQLDMFLDPQQDLPLARLEGLPGSGWPTHIGQAATTARFRQALAQPGGIQLSTHGVFDPANPFSSWLALADGKIALSELYDSGQIKRQLIVLSSCESGLSQRSNSDEPFGFPALLQSAGVHQVIAPCWRVDDLATLLLMSEFHRLIADQHAPEQAIYRASHWLRQLDAEQALHRIETIEASISPDEQSCFDDALVDLRQQKTWLHSHRYDIQCPFQSPVFWAGFQAWGSSVSTTRGEP